jgi:hypothetical protein
MNYVFSQTVPHVLPPLQHALHTMVQALLLKTALPLMLSLKQLAVTLDALV